MITLIAHRGKTLDTLENTVEGLIKSLEQKEVGGVELDIRMSKDKKFIIYHDFLINDKKRPLRKVSSLTLKEIQEYQVKGHTVDTLEDFLKSVHTSKKIMIEIKAEEQEFDEIIPRLHHLLRQYPELHFMICSFHYELMKQFKKKYPEYKVGLIIGNLLNGNHLSNMFDFVSLSIDYLEAWKFQKETCFWTINRVSQLQKIISKTQNVFIITDQSKKLATYLESSS